jgi:hypothetical protein
MHVGTAAAGHRQGVREANRRLANQRLRRTGWPVVSGCTLVELYLDRATEAWHALRVLATAEPLRYASRR